MAEPMKRDMRNPLFWHEHPNPWVRRTFVVVSFVPLFFVLIPLVFGWLWLRATGRAFGTAMAEFWEETWDVLCTQAGTWWEGVTLCPRIWWRPPEEHAAYARKLQGDDDDAS